MELLAGDGKYSYNAKVRSQSRQGRAPSKGGTLDPGGGEVGGMGGWLGPYQNWKPEKASKKRWKREETQNALKKKPARL